MNPEIKAKRDLIEAQSTGGIKRRVLPLKTVSISRILRQQRWDIEFQHLRYTLTLGG